MGRRTTVAYQGKETAGEDLKFEGEKETWNVYRTEDGTEVKLKTVVSNIIRLDAYTAEGDPIYLVKSIAIVASDIPEVLKRKSGEKSTTH